jgi:hypothetical protein
MRARARSSGAFVDTGHWLRQHGHPLVHWVRDDHLVVDGTTFHLMGFRGERDKESFHLMKTRALVEEYLRRVPEFRGGRVFEVGLFRGGSVALLTSVLAPLKFVGIDINGERNPQLDRWLAKRGDQHRVRLHYGVDQADRSALRHLMTTEFDDHELDLAIDDASHQLTPTAITFNTLFPRLRVGGVYIIEDWNAGLHWRRRFSLHSEKHLDENQNVRAASADAERPRRGTGTQAAESADSVPRVLSAEGEMWRFTLRTVLALGAHQNLISEMNFAPSFVALRRGPESLDPDAFDLRDWLVGLEI